MGEPCGVPRGTKVRHITEVLAGVSVGLFPRLWMSTGCPQLGPHVLLGERTVVHRLHRFSTGCAPLYQQGYPSSSTQGAPVGINGMHTTEPHRANQDAGEISVRLRAVGNLADRLDAGADLSQVVDFAKAIVASCANVVDSEEDEPVVEVPG